MLRTNSLGVESSASATSARNTVTSTGIVDINSGTGSNDHVEEEQQFLHDAPSCLNESKSTVRPIPLGANDATPTFDTMHPHISSLQNEHSSYLAVSKACLFFNQLASYASCSPLPPSSIALQSHLFDANYVSQFSTITASLSFATLHHTDRRCRILSIHSLSIVSKAIFAKLIFTPLYIDHDDVDIITRLQDDIYNDVVTNLVSSALEDDDGVASVAFEALARFNMLDTSSHHTHSDLLQREIHSITGDTAPWKVAHDFVHPMQDLDVIRYNAEVTCKILTLLAPRARKILNRVQLLKSRWYQLRSLGFLNEIIMFVCQKDQMGAHEQRMDKEIFASRWYEFDLRTTVQEYVQTVFIPLLRLSKTVEGSHIPDGNIVSVGVCTATHALRLISLATRGDSWVDQVLPLAIQNLELGLEKVNELGSMEAQMDIVATLLVALRGVSLDSRTRSLERIAIFISKLPSTRVIPQRVVAAALVHKDGSQRKPVRMGFWTEIAISFLGPDRNGEDSHLFVGDLSSHHAQQPIQCRALSSFLASKAVSSVLDLGQDNANVECMVLNLAHELLYAFCSVAHSIGQNMIANGGVNTGNPGPQHVSGTYGASYSAHIRHEQWFGTALILLNFFMPCLGWTRKEQLQEEEEEEASTMLFAAQRAYMELLKLVMTQSGTIAPSTSIYYHFMESVGYSSTDNKEIDSSPIVNERIENRISLLLDKTIAEMTTLMKCRKIRLSLLCLLTDAWIQHCHNAVATGERERREFKGPVDIDNDIVNINERHAQNILSMLSSEISGLINGEKIRSSKADTPLKHPVAIAGEELRSLLTCIACVESIAYSAQLCANHFFSTKGNVDDEESARYLVSVSMLVLKGQGKVETDDDEDSIVEGESTEAQGSCPSSPPHSPRSKARITAFTSECTAAAKRLRNFVGLNEDGHDADGVSHLSVDFDCLCPLLKRPHFGVPPEDEDSRYDLQPTRINGKWISADRITLVDCDTQAPSPESQSQIMSVPILLDPNVCLDQDLYEHGFLFHLCRQQVSALVEPALHSNIFYMKESSSESRHFNTESILRSRPGSNLAMQNPRSAMNNYLPKVQEITGCSDPVSATMCYSVRRCARYDGYTEFKLIVTMLVFNVTPVSITNGLRLKLILTPRVENDEDDCPTDSAGVEGSSIIDAVYMNELKGGQRLVWELVLGAEQAMNHTISASVSLMSISSAYDDSNSSRRDAKLSNIAWLKQFPSEMPLLIPSNEVFFDRDRFDGKFFFFLWQNMQHSLPIVDIPSDNSFSSLFPLLSDWAPQDLWCGPHLVQVWALSTLSGRHLLVLSVITTKQEYGYKQVFIKSDDMQLLDLIFRR